MGITDFNRGIEGTIKGIIPPILVPYSEPERKGLWVQAAGKESVFH